MSTRSAIGWQQSPFAGRYVHFDGSPEWVGRELCNMIRINGVDAAMDMLTHQHYGWASLDSAMSNPPSSEVLERYNEPRYEIVPGYGVAYTDYVYPNGYQQIEANDWVTANSQCNTVWQYAVAPDGDIVVYYDFHVLGHVNAFSDDYMEKLSALEHQIYG